MNEKKKATKETQLLASAIIAAATPVVAATTEPSIMTLVMYACQTLVTKNDSKE
jgi:hypothetical protein